MTGLIYVAIIAVWAVVLVPAWLRRHDHRDPERSVDRFTRSMQTLAARPSVLGIPMPTSEERTEAADEPAADVVQPRRGAPRRGKAPTAGPVVRRRARLGGRQRPRRRPSAAARRRIVLGILLAALVVVGGLVLSGLLIPGALAIPSVLILGFLALARHQVRKARRQRGRRVPPRPDRITPASPAAAPTTAAASGAGSTWEARATPLPAYVTAPPAAGYPRVIDQTPGAWTAAAMLERAQKQKVRAERMAAAKAEAIARARAEQEASQVPTRDEEYLAAQAVVIQPTQHDTVPLRRIRAVNE